MFAERATFSAADVTADVHLSTGFCEREVGWTQADFCIGTEHLLGEEKQHLFQVGERNIFVHIQCLHLVEEAVCTIADGFVTVNASRADDADRWL